MAMLTFLLLLCAAFALDNAQNLKDKDKEILKDLLHNLPMVNQGPQSRSSSCPHGWANYGKVCYQYVSILASWTDAELICLQLGGNLASVHSLSEYNFLWSVLKSGGAKSPVWIGAHDAVKEGVWLWSDGSRFTYQKWNRGEPNNSGGQENCMQMNFGAEGGQNDEKCWFQYPCMCARKL
ncbi:ladderlectin [Esox lucius]|uniref:ladderlectin n=1 Tax=Esox lucius TaxID=8010 RepID=UPI001476B533|nr:ladderlectin [Esox lucius]